MDQKDLNADNRMLLSEFLKAVADGELVAAVVTVRTDGKGLGWYPAVPGKGNELLSLLRQEPDKVVIEPTRKTTER